MWNELVCYHFESFGKPKSDYFFFFFLFFFSQCDTWFLDLLFSHSVYIEPEIDSLEQSEATRESLFVVVARRSNLFRSLFSSLCPARPATGPPPPAASFIGGRVSFSTDVCIPFDNSLAVDTTTGSTQRSRQINTLLQSLHGTIIIATRAIIHDDVPR